MDGVVRIGCFPLVFSFQSTFTGLVIRKIVDSFVASSSSEDGVKILIKLEL